MATPDSDGDPSLQSALRVARFYALVSARTIRDELGVSDAEAKRLFDELVQRGFLGEVIVERTQARESLVNMVFDGSGRSREDSEGLTDTTPGDRLLVGLALVSVLLGLAACVYSTASGISIRLTAASGLGSISPSFPALLAYLVVSPTVGLLFGKAAEWILRAVFGPADDLVSLKAEQFAANLWSAYGLIALSFGAYWLFTHP